ncbi:4485_t:CDS:1, partial [Paraglomus occultum]
MANNIVTIGLDFLDIDGDSIGVDISSGKSDWVGVIAIASVAVGMFEKLHSNSNSNDGEVIIL